MIAAGAPITAAAAAPTWAPADHRAGGEQHHQHQRRRLRHQRRAPQAHLRRRYLTGFPATLPVTYTLLNGGAGHLPAGGLVPYQSGMTIAVGGVSFSIAGALRIQDSFTGPTPPASPTAANAVALGQGCRPPS